MRNTRVLIIVSCISVVLCGVLVFVMWAKNLNKKSNQSLNPPRKEQTGKYKQNLNLLPTPQNGAKDVTLDSLISIKLLQPNPTSNITVTIAPEISHKISYTSSLIVIYHENLKPGTTYTLLVASANKDKTTSYDTFSFTTKGVAPNPVNTFGSTNIAKKNNQFQLQNHPDIFLVNNVPYHTSTFSIDQQSSRNGMLQFQVTLSGDKSASKNDFIAWTHNIGLSDDQLGKLLIDYK